MLADEALTHSVEQSMPIYVGCAEFYRGSTVARSDPERGIKLMQDAINSTDKNGTALFRPAHVGHLAAAFTRVGEAETGLGLLEEAIATAEKSGERFFEAELHRMRGDILVQLGQQTEAIASFAHALHVARAQQARMWELRAATSLARLWCEEGKRAEARELLASVYGWFTEAFDTPDLKDAKALLDTLT